MSSNTIYKPTWLYIKQHNQTGLKYFGKTTKADPTKYLGSGTYWKQHLKKHGTDISTLWCQYFEDRNELVSYALQFSKENNIVKSREWANLIDENGLTGFPVGQIRTDAHRENLSKATKGRKDPRSAEVKAEAGRKASAKLKGKKKPAGFGEKVRQAHAGKSYSPKAKENMRAAWTEERKAAQAIIQSKRNAARPVLTCPHCGKQGANSGIMKKYHFDNCAPTVKSPKIIITRTFCSPAGQEFQTTNMKEFAKQHSLNSNLLGQVALGHAAHHRGWTFVKEERNVCTSP